MNAKDIEVLFEVAERVTQGRSVTPTDKAIIREELPAIFDEFRNATFPARVTHPAGFTVSGAPVRNFALASLLLCGHRGLGKRYGGNPFYECREREVAFGIMRSNFHHGYPRGTHCCSQCTLATLPVLRAGAVRYFDCKPLVENVVQLVENRQ